MLFIYFPNLPTHHLTKCQYLWSCKTYVIMSRQDYDEPLKIESLNKLWHRPKLADVPTPTKKIKRFLFFAIANCIYSFFQVLKKFCWSLAFKRNTVTVLMQKIIGIQCFLVYMNINTNVCTHTCTYSRNWPEISSL